MKEVFLLPRFVCSLLRRSRLSGRRLSGEELAELVFVSIGLNPADPFGEMVQVREVL